MSTSKVPDKVTVSVAPAVNVNPVTPAVIVNVSPLAIVCGVPPSPAKVKVVEPPGELFTISKVDPAPPSLIVIPVPAVTYCEFGISVVVSTAVKNL